MFPWLWFWAPQVHFPWSGDVAQRIDPVTHWFFQGIEPDAGHARIEEKAFSVASYGKQLGLITELLLALAERDGAPAEAAGALEKLKGIAAEIEAIKQVEYGRDAADIESRLQAMQRRGGVEFEQLARRLQPLLAGAPAPKIAASGPRKNPR